MLGFVSACYQLGSIIGVPFAPYINQRFGRRWPIMGGSITMIIGALIQGFAQNSRSSYVDNEIDLTFYSWNVHFRTYGPRIWNCFLHHFGFLFDWRAGTSKRSRYIDIPIQLLLFYRLNHSGSDQSQNNWHPQRLELARSLSPADVPLPSANNLRFVRL
jgi:MFS family permease